LPVLEGEEEGKAEATTAAMGSSSIRVYQMGGPEPLSRVGLAEKVSTRKQWIDLPIPAPRLINQHTIKHTHNRSAPSGAIRSSCPEGT
jgi:hypothetical protein